MDSSGRSGLPTHLHRAVQLNRVSSRACRRTAATETGSRSSPECLRWSRGSGSWRSRSLQSRRSPRRSTRRSRTRRSSSTGRAPRSSEEWFPRGGTAAAAPAAGSAFTSQGLAMTRALSATVTAALVLGTLALLLAVTGGSVAAGGQPELWQPPPRPGGNTSSRAPTATSPRAAGSTSRSARRPAAGARACAPTSSTSTSTSTRGSPGTTARSTRRG